LKVESRYEWSCEASGGYKVYVYVTFHDWILDYMYVRVRERDEPNSSITVDIEVEEPAEVAELVNQALDTAEKLLGNTEKCREKRETTVIAEEDGEEAEEGF